MPQKLCLRSFRVQNRPLHPTCNLQITPHIRYKMTTEKQVVTPLFFILAQKILEARRPAPTMCVNFITTTVHNTEKYVTT